MSAMSAQTIGTTHDCKTPGCEGTAKSAVGLYSYCDDCRRERAAAKPASNGNGHGSDLSARIAALSSLAKQVDRAKAKAEKAQKAANEAGRTADRLAADFKKAASEVIDA